MRARQGMARRRRSGEPLHFDRQTGLNTRRQMMLSQMLGMTNDQLLGRLYGGTPAPGVIQLRARGSAPSSNPNSGRIEQAHAELKRAIEHLQELMPDATVTVTITYRGQ
jgi:hypothetical protein